MNELEIQISKQGEISFNLDGLKKELSEIADRYEGIVVSEESVPLAKKDLAAFYQTAFSLFPAPRDCRVRFTHVFEQHCRAHLLHRHEHFADDGGRGNAG